MKFYIQSQDASIDFVVDCDTPGEALAKALERHIEAGCTNIEPVYLWHMGQGLDAAPMPSCEAYWHLEPAHRRVLSKAVQLNHPEIYSEWCDLVVESAPDDESEEEY